MKLFLAAEAKHPESIKKLEKFIGKDLKGLKVVYIPTAANGEDGWESWKKGGSIALAKSSMLRLKLHCWESWTEFKPFLYNEALYELNKAILCNNEKGRV